mmetsp:Transcript_19717/g.35701  ORF Transcript_19717/g.35701 Transcript_19717/m.35701 type:complete len:631 (-) Transcript_19717:65-1957(-)
MSLKNKVLALLVGFIAVCALAAYLVGIAVVLLVLTVTALLLHLNSARVLAWLVCWGISKTPKKFRWSIRRVFIRARFETQDSDWSMIIMEGWTWHNPPGFSEHDEINESYILQCDRLVAHLKLRSIVNAVTNHGSIDIDMLELHGFRFNAQANEKGTINLWKAIDLPDDDVNVIMQTVTDQTQPIGRHHAVMKNIKALPPVSSGATRKATNFWRDEWGQRNHDSLKDKKMTTAESVKKKAKQKVIGDTNTTPLLSGYFEYPIGDPRRRPRWGVPVRFDIRRLFLVDVELWVLDLLIKNPSTTEERKLNRIELEKIVLSREQLEAGDKRKSGGGDEWHEGDGVHGIYLGELVWALVARVVPKVAFSSPSRALRDAMSACGFCATHLMQKVEAKSIQGLLSFAGRSLGAGETIADIAKRGPGAKLKVHLLAGREITVDDYKAANSFIQMRLWNVNEGAYAATPESEAHSQLRIWSKEPHWDEHFELGPVRSVQSTLQLLCYHCRKTDVMKHPVHMAPQTRHLIGHVTIPIGQLLLEDASIGADRLIVGWFPLETEQERHGGEVKVGLQVMNAEQLMGLEGAYQAAQTKRPPSEQQGPPGAPGPLAPAAEIDSSTWGCALCVPMSKKGDKLDP